MKQMVIGRNIEITDAIKNRLDRKINKTFHGIDENTDIHVSLHVEKYRHIAEVTVKTKRFTAYANKMTSDLYITMDSVLEKIEKQLKKHKEREQDQKIKNGAGIKNNSNN